MSKSFSPPLLSILIAIAVSSCSSPPLHETRTVTPEAVRDATPSFGDEIALRAIAQVGTRYRYGGADEKGFDCSGLVYFIHQELGITVPRTAAAQYAASTPVNVHNLIPGDLLFFRTTRSHRITHVAIYAGGGRFVHAPQTGRRIELRDLGDEYYGPRLVGAGRMRNSVLDNSVSEPQS